MRSIARFDAEGDAQLAADVLVSRSIDAEVRPGDDDWVLWVLDDATLDDARDLLTRFAAEPDHPDFADAQATARARRKDREARDRAYSKRIALAQRTMHGANGRAALTTVLLVASALVALASGIGRDLELLTPLFLTTQPAAAMLPELRAGQVWRLFTPILVHFGVMHLVFNGWMWWSFGRVVEIRKGTGLFALLVGTAAVVTNLSEFGWGLLSRPGALSRVGGLSGVLYAVFGYVLAKGRIDPLDGLAVPQQTTVLLLGWLVLCMTPVLGSIANAAHLSGLVYGALFAAAEVGLFRLRKGGPR